LNKRSGPAVQGPRAQIDRDLYKNHLQNHLRKLPNLRFLESSVEDLLVEPKLNECVGVITKDGHEIYCKKVILTTGTFLRGQVCYAVWNKIRKIVFFSKINIGLKVIQAGRMGDAPAIGLAKTLERLNFSMGRLKTGIKINLIVIHSTILNVIKGTPPRIQKSTIDFTNLKAMPGDDVPTPFSFLNDKVWIEPEDQINSYMTSTNSKVTRDSLCHDQMLFYVLLNYSRST
jgi:tRNA uridine 5-carboxymethylaminomethyl modification enzyme